MSTTAVSRNAESLRESPATPCILVVFGASGDLTRRLLIPAIYNLVCDGLIGDRFAIIGVARSPLDDQSFRAELSESIRKFSTRPEFADADWQSLVDRVHYLAGAYDDPDTFVRLAACIDDIGAKLGTGGNVLYYLAMPPALFGTISTNLKQAGAASEADGWTRIVVEKPFGSDLSSAIELNRTLLEHWREDQIYRIDHYLGKETVQNLLAFRFSNGIFEPLWNRHHVDHIQFTVAESVGVEGRGRYYERAGVLRDMVQNHMFQMLAYLCMEPPTSFKADAVRNEKAKLLDAVRIMSPDEVARCTVRGQYGASATEVGYRSEPDVDPQSFTETFAALELHIDNWRWEGVPIYVRSGKRLWKRGTEILVQFKKAPEVIYRETPEVDGLENNQLLFHMQPDQGIELRFQAKTPGPTMALRKVNMRFDYQEAFTQARGTGYEMLLYSAMNGDATLFSRTDLVETSWRIVQPILDAWSKAPTEGSLSTYRAGSWGPRAAFDLIERGDRKWLEVANRDVLDKVPLFAACDPTFLRNLSLMLEPRVFTAGQVILAQGDVSTAMYVIVRGQVDVLDEAGEVLNSLRDGDVFGETGLLLAKPRGATIQARSQCDLFVLDRSDFRQALRQRPALVRSILDISIERFHLDETTKAALERDLSHLLPS